MEVKRESLPPPSSTASAMVYSFLSTMPNFENSSVNYNRFPSGGIFLEPSPSPSLIDLISSPSPKAITFNGFKTHPPKQRISFFMNVSLGGGNAVLEKNPQSPIEEEAGANAAIRNPAKHLCAGAVAAVVSSTCLAPLERLKLEYIIRGEEKSILRVITSIATTQGLKGFWKGNLLNILRTAPFKAINFCAYDTYRKQLLRLTGNEETTNVERLIAGAAAGITATLLCLPLDTIRTKIVAKGGEALGGIFGAFRHTIRTEGFFALYKGLVPSVMSMAPSSAVFYGVYDALKASYLQSPEGMERVEKMKTGGTTLDKLELGTVRTLLYGAIAGVCAEAATYPFEVVRRQLQLHVGPAKMNAFATFVKVVDKGGISALYAGLLPGLLQVLPSAAISYFVYEFMRVVLGAQ